MENSALEFQGEPDAGETQQFCEIYLQKLNEVSIVNIREKLSVLPIQGRERNPLPGTPRGHYDVLGVFLALWVPCPNPTSVQIGDIILWQASSKPIINMFKIAWPVWLSWWEHHPVPERLWVWFLVRAHI